MNTKLFVAMASVSMVACESSNTPDAFGNFEANEIVVSAEVGGQLMWFTGDDGIRVSAGDTIGMIDTTQMVLEQNLVLAQQLASKARTVQARQQVKALQAQQDIAKRTYDRTQRLHTANAATALQLDQAEGEYRIVTKQIEAAEAQYSTVQQDVNAMNARVGQIRDRLKKSQIVNPRTGTILTSYVKQSEFVQPGQPLYKIANLDSLIVRVYVVETQLASIQIGQSVNVTFDVGKAERRTVTGVVSWIASEAEFTPTPIQTRDERTGLVYAVKVVVPNTDGAAKIGMPTDVRFTKGNGSSD